MKSKCNYRFSGLKLLLIIFALQLIFSGGVAASNVPSTQTASASWNLHQGDVFKRTATDLHFTFGIDATEAEFNNWYIKTWTVSLKPIDGAQNIGLPDDSVLYYTTYGNIYAITYIYNDLSIPWCSKYKLTVELDNNYCNMLEFSDVKWSYGPWYLEMIPDNIFIFSELGYTETTHDTKYIFRNNDAEVALTINYLTFYRESRWIEPDSQWVEGVFGVPFYEAGPFSLGPGDSVEINFADMSNAQGLYIYVAGEMEYQMTDFDYEIVEFRQAHEEPRLRQVPTIGEWGIYILLIFLVASGCWIILRRRHTSEAKV